MVPVLFESLKASAAEWRQEGYPCEEFPLIGEILSFHTGERHSFLREPQILALEVYWYVRLVLNTPHTIDLYRHYYGHEKKLFCQAIGIRMHKDALDYVEIDDIIKRTKDDPDFVQEKNVKTLHEAIKLDYPSYIIALAMGAGKTVLIGAIIATEFSMSLRHEKGRFMKNALVFAPGTTIIESLRELTEIRYENILPPGLYRDFSANLKIEFPRNGGGVQALKGSVYNLIVTNTEKISLRAATQKKNQSDLDFSRKEVLANIRLQKIASLPNLGVFSDEAHHTYGNVFDKLKRVRETINFIHEETPIVAVVNTTGTPYYRRQPLKEVLVWYGLGDGIKDGYLKSLENGICQYDIGEQKDEDVLDAIITDFFKSYGDVSLPNGERSKIAFYFKTQEHLEDSRQHIEKSMRKIGENISQVLVNTQQSSMEEENEFKKLNSPTSQKRVILLIGRGIEGWNCPSLFACALIKEQTSSNNYVLQAATRCLRQTPDNVYPARIFLDQANAQVLDRQLQDNFGTSLDRVSGEMGDKETVTLRILKPELPKLEIKRMVSRVVREDNVPERDISLTKPKSRQMPALFRRILTLDFGGPREILMRASATEELPTQRRTHSCYSIARKISSRYHLPILPTLKELMSLYSDGEIPDKDIYGLFRQIEDQQSNYRTVQEEVTEIMALIRLQDEEGQEIFKKDEEGFLIHRLRLHRKAYEKMVQQDLFAQDGEYEDKHDLSFHYAPYNFDSEPERSLFRQVLHALNTDPNDVEAFLFTGGITDTNKTDFYFEYQGEDSRYHHYFPDFVIIKKTGEFYIVEVKAEGEKNNPTVVAKKKAVERVVGCQPDKFKYNIVYAPATVVPSGGIDPIIDWVRGP